MLRIGAVLVAVSGIAPPFAFGQPVGLEGALSASAAAWTWPQEIRERATHPLSAFVKSAVVPGWQQWSYGKQSAWAYLAVEGLGWFALLHQRQRGAQHRDAYRDYAWERARLQAPRRRDGDFDYYERLANYPASGAYDRDAAPGVQPESDPATYNGRIWDLAVGLFLGTATPGPGVPGYAEALEYYRQRAYTDDFLWDWRGDGAAQATYRGLIGDSDRAFRNARGAAGLLITNHVLSALDGYLAARGPAGLPRASVAPAPGAPGGAVRWSAELRWSLR